MWFAYKAVDAAGFPQHGELEATSESDALQSLFERGVTPIDLKERQSGKSLKGSGSQSIRRSDVVALIRELATLLGSGVGLSETLTTLYEATSHPGIRTTLSKLITDVHGGEGFSAALAGAGLDLPEYVHALARAGEATGDFGGALARCADQLEFEEGMRNQVREALIYPAILISTGVAAIVFIFSFVVPRFASILKGRAVDLPWISEWVLNTGMFVRGHWELMLVAIIVVAVTATLLLRNPAIRMAAIARLSRLPFFSDWISSAETSRWTSILAVLVQSRVPILLSLELAASSVRLRDNSARLRSVEDDVRRGKRLSAAIEDRRLLEGSALTMLKVGEHSGELGKMLTYVAASTAERFRQLQKRVVALIEPISILVIGLVIGVVMVGVVLAMTSLTEIKL